MNEEQRRDVAFHARVKKLAEGKEGALTEAEEVELEATAEEIGALPRGEGEPGGIGYFSARLAGYLSADHRNRAKRTGIPAIPATWAHLRDIVRYTEWTLAPTRWEPRP